MDSDLAPSRVFKLAVRHPVRGWQTPFTYFDWRFWDDILEWLALDCEIKVWRENDC